MFTIADQRHAENFPDFGLPELISAGYADPSDRCGCGHTRETHTGRLVAARDRRGRPRPARFDSLYPGACALMICGCECFRGELDRCAPL